MMEVTVVLRHGVHKGLPVKQYSSPSSATVVQFQQRIQPALDGTESWKGDLEWFFAAPDGVLHPLEDWNAQLSTFLPKPSAAAGAPPTSTVTFILKPPAPAPIPAGPGVPDGTSKKTYAQFMAEQFPDDVFDSHIIELAQWNFFSKIEHALETNDKKLAKKAYEMALALPQTSTRDRMAEHAHLNLGDPLFPDSPLHYAFRGCTPFVVKGLGPAEKRRAESLVGYMRYASIKQFQHITTFNLLFGGKEYVVDGDPSKDTDKLFMVMPAYPVCLERVPHLEKLEVAKLWKQLSAALQHLHSHGLAFMDVKPSNVCVNGEGNFIFIDVGSVAAFGFSTEATAHYIPQDMCPEDAGRVKAHPKYDWAMLLALLSEKCCGPLPDGYSVVSGSRTAKSTQHLWARLRASLWDPDRAEDGTSPICNELAALMDPNVLNVVYEAGCASWSKYEMSRPGSLLTGAIAGKE